MEKYGVQTDADTAKEAQQKDSPACPECGETLCDNSNTGVLLCPNCGSRPFEKSE